MAFELENDPSADAPYGAQHHSFLATHHDRAYSEHAWRWSRLDRGTVFLNHGSFGACPDAVLAKQRELRDRLEAEPVRFMVQTLQPLWDAARERVAEFVNADPAGLAFVTNATEAVSAVVRSIRFEPGDELLTTNHNYNACINALRYAAEQQGATAVVAEVPFPIASPDEAAAAILDRVSSKTRLALIDHITSPTGLRLPVETLIPALRERGVTVLIDGAHAPGSIPLDIASLGADFYAANLHKWICAPKGAGFLWTAPEHRSTTVPAVISHGYNADTSERSRYRQMFDWTGTADPTAVLCVPSAIDVIASTMPEGWTNVMRRNNHLVRAARDLIHDRLGLGKPHAPDEMITSLAAIALPPSNTDTKPDPMNGVGGYPTTLQRRLVADFHVQVPVNPWPKPGARLLRLSAHIYNAMPGYETLADALEQLLPET